MNIKLFACAFILIHFNFFAFAEDHYLTTEIIGSITQKNLQRTQELVSLFDNLSLKEKAIVVRNLLLKSDNELSMQIFAILKID
jgi:hypothetical protein